MAYIDDEIDLDEDFGETEVPDFRDYTLRLDPSKTAGKDFVVARFQSEVPELPDTQTVRLFRDGEDTLKRRSEQRRAAEKEEEHQQNAVLKDYKGKKVIRPTKSKKNTYRKTMYPRHLRNWNLELSNEKTDAESNPVIETQVFTGSYENTGDGKSNVQYAFLLLNDDDTIDVVPVGDRAWYFFRARQHRTQTLEEIESKQRKGAVKDEKRLEVLETKLQESQAKEEMMMGSLPVEEKPNIGGEGGADGGEGGDGARVRRKRRPSKSEGAEEVDFEAEFDDDDLQQEGSEEEKGKALATEGDTPWNKGTDDQPFGSDSENEGGEPRLSNVGMDLQRLLDKEDSADKSDGKQSPGRPGSPASQFSRSPNQSPPGSPPDGARGKAAKRANAYDSDHSAKKVKR